MEFGRDSVYPRVPLLGFPTQKCDVGQQSIYTVLELVGFLEQVCGARVNYVQDSGQMYECRKPLHIPCRPRIEFPTQVQAETS